MAQKYVLKVKTAADDLARENGEQLPETREPGGNTRPEVCEHSATTITLIVGGIFVAAVLVYAAFAALL